MKSIPFVVALVVLWVGPAWAGSYFPIQPSSSWEYVGDQGGNARARILGSQEVLGANTTVREWVRTSTTSPESLVNYWSTNTEGDVFLHGFTRFDGLQLIYDPPVLFLDMPLSMDRTWQTVTVVYSDFGGAFPTGDTLTVGYQVSSIGDRTVPAGSWFGYAVREGVVSSGTEKFSLTLAGTALRPEDEPFYENWFVQDVGEIEIQTDEVFKLATMSLPPTAVEAVSWTTIKSLYR